MEIFLGSDHGGYEMKNDIKKHLEEKGVHVTDLGSFKGETIDYPDMAREVCEKVIEYDPKANGILVCGTGIGMMMAANKMPNIRAALCTDEYMAEMAKRHNNSNVLCLGGKVIDSDLALKIVDKFMSSEFEKDKERHVRRVGKIDHNMKTDPSINKD